MRTVEIKNANTGKVVIRVHYWSTDQVIQKWGKDLPAGDYLIQGSNSMACSPRISKKAWEQAERFTVDNSWSTLLNP